jgi:hypothetical protein
MLIRCPVSGCGRSFATAEAQQQHRRDKHKPKPSVRAADYWEEIDRCGVGFLGSEIDLRPGEKGE